MAAARKPTQAQIEAVQSYVRQHHPKEAADPAAFLALVQKILSIGGPILQMIVALFGNKPTPTPTPPAA